MPDLLSGTLTFLLTDVQDSTRLWEQSPETMRQALARHDELIESLAEEHDGIVVRPRGEGDSRFLVFVRAIDGVSAAAAIQRALQAESWPTPTPLSVRICLHTGEGEFQDGDYYGSAVNRCARLRGIAYGGQILLSRTTSDLVRDRLSEGLELRDLGFHPLKGLERPEHIFQLSGPGLPVDFPPLLAGRPGVKIEPKIPAFIETEADMQAEPVFVARERELKRLDSFLRTAVDGKGQVAFVSGEPGRGKSALLQAFARRAQVNNPGLLVACGACNAYSGIGDPFLPFRDVFAMLIGDVEDIWKSGGISCTHALTLWKALPHTIDALVSRGPDLINILFPGDVLLSHALTAAPRRAETLSRLAKFSQLRAGSGSDIQQSQLFEQCTNTLQVLAETHPLLLVLDDLQWADTASISLLFHLGRRLATSRILILGAYRPYEISQGRGGGKHPLEGVLLEFQRLYGDIIIDLSRRDEIEERKFVEALLDTESNRLGEEFRRQMTSHTGGHPLFTLELLRHMQARGYLLMDQDGRWTHSPTLNWDDLPPQIEGVIVERLSRLEDGLHDILAVASVEGETFTAQVVAKIQDIRERTLIRQLSETLEKQHKLVQEVGEVSVGERILSHYRFLHILYQQYIYNNLGGGERRLLHREIGEVLEAIYADRAEEIAAKLAIHFEKAGIQSKAAKYLQLAGERAANQYAHQEAIDHLSRALELIPQEDKGRRFDLLLAREKVYRLRGERLSQLAHLGKLEALAESLGDPGRQAKVALRKAMLAEVTGKIKASRGAAREAVRLAREAQDQSLEAAGLYQWGKALWRTEEDPEVARTQIEQALALAQANPQGTFGGVETLHILGTVYAARVQLEQALLAARKGQHTQVEADSLYTLGVVTLILGDSEGAKASYEQALQRHRAIGDRRGEAHCLTNLGVLSLNIEGNPSQASTYFIAVRLISREMGDRQSEAFSLTNLGEVAAFTGDYIQARSYQEKALAIYEDIGAQRDVGFCIKELALIDLHQGFFDQARVKFDQALSIFREHGEHRGERMTLSDLGTFWRMLGATTSARETLEQALASYKERGLQEGQGRVYIELGLLDHQQGEFQAALEYCQQAVELLKGENRNPNYLAAGLTALAQTLASTGGLEEAIETYEKALQMRHEMSQPHLAAEIQAGLAQVHHAQGNTGQALAYVEVVLGTLESGDPSTVLGGNLEGTAEPFGVYLACYRVLKANQDPRAGELLSEAYDLLQERAGNIDDEDLRRSFLEDIASHRELSAEYLNQ
jgi:adenylate cyclase